MDIGDVYQGGIIFYIWNGGLNGYIAAENDSPTKLQWGGINVILNNGLLIGDGIQNTSNMYTAGSESATYCYNLTTSGYTDWFIPSRDELYEMFKIRNLLNFTNYSDYWSSSEHEYDPQWNSWILFPGSTNQKECCGSYKGGSFYVRPIREYSST